MYNLKKFEKWKDDEGKKVYRTEGWIIIELKKGAIAGEHYHKGLIKIKNPEINVILNGKLKYKLQDVNTNKKEEVIVEAPAVIEIHPFVYHELEAIEDSEFIEPFDETAKQDRWEL